MVLFFGLVFFVALENFLSTFLVIGLALMSEQEQLISISPTCLVSLDRSVHNIWAGKILTTL